MSLIQYIKSKDVQKVTSLLNNEEYHPTVEEKEFAIALTIEYPNADILKLLLNDEQKRFNPAAQNDLPLQNTIMYGDIELLKLLIADSRVNPASRNNAAIRLAAGSGFAEGVLLLLADSRVDPSSNDNAALYCAISEEHTNIVRMLLPHLKEAGIPWSTFIDITLSSAELLANTELFMEDKLRYISSFSPLTDQQCNAFELLLLQEEIHAMEIEQIAALADDNESAMNDSKVLKSRQFFEFVQAHFIETFNQFGENDDVRIIAIEKLIRAMILDDICAGNINEDQKSFIAANREALETASDESIMKFAREKYFNSHSANHAAWRGYDANAPYEGYHKNLLTIQKDNVALFSTAASGNVTSVEASHLIRKMMTYYYLLVTDPKEPELHSLRTANFIAELADLRLAHQSECDGKDAPSCYPGYFGRMLNLSYGHTLNKHLVTPKTIIMEYLSPIILEEFRKVLHSIDSAENCERYLQALSWITLSQAKSIVLGLSDFPKELLEMRHDFINNLLINKKELHQAINEQLKAQGMPPLDEIGEKFINLCLRDPAREFNFKRLGAVYTQHLQTTYPATPIKPTHLVERAVINPFKEQYKAAKKIPHVQQERLLALKQKSKLYKKLNHDMNETAKRELMADENSFDPQGMVLLLKVAITECPNHDLSAQTLFSEKFEEIFEDNAKSDSAYPQALNILQLFKNRMNKIKTPTNSQPLSESPSKTLNSEVRPVKPSVVKRLFQN